jgi:hypothetical protein
MEKLSPRRLEKSTSSKAPHASTFGRARGAASWLIFRAVCLGNVARYLPLRHPRQAACGGVVGSDLHQGSSPIALVSPEEAMGRPRTEARREPRVIIVAFRLCRLRITKNTARLDLRGVGRRLITPCTTAANSHTPGGC